MLASLTRIIGKELRERERERQTERERERKRDFCICIHGSYRPKSKADPALFSENEGSHSRLAAHLFFYFIFLSYLFTLQFVIKLTRPSLRWMYFLC